MGKFQQKLTALVLSAATITGIAAMPVSAATTILWKDNFNNATDAMGVVQGTSSLVSDYSEGKALKITAGSGGVVYFEKTIDAVTDGIVELSYSFMPEDGARPTLVLIPSAGASQAKTFMEMTDDGAVYASQKTLSGVEQKAQLLRSGLEHGKWYNIEYKINMANKTYEAFLYNDKGVVLGNAHGSHTFADLSRVRFLAYGAEGKSVVYDNINVVHKPLADYSILIDENFNYYQSFDNAQVAKLVGNATADLDCGRNGTYQSLRVKSTGTDMIVYQSNFVNSVPADKYKVSFEMYAGAGTDTSFVICENGSKMTTLITMKADGTLFAGDTVGGNPVEANVIKTGANLERWYDAELVLDMTTHGYLITVTAQDGTKLCENKPISYSVDLTAMNRYRFNLSNPTVDAISKLDSIKVERYDEVADKALYRETFDSYKNVSESPILVGTSGNARFVEDRNGGNALELSTTAASNVPFIASEVGGVTEAGKYEINFSIKPSKGNNVVQFLENGGLLDTLTFNNGTIEMKRVNVGTYTADTWYDVKLELVLPQGAATVTVTDPNGDSESANIPAVSISKLRGFRFVGYSEALTEGGNLCKVTIDDISVFKDDQAITFTAAADGGALTEVAPSLSTVTLTFAQDMKDSTLNSDNIYIINKTTGEKVYYTSSYANKVYTMTLSEFLSDGGQYELVVTTDVKTADDLANSSDVKVAFSAKAAQATDYKKTIIDADFSKSIGNYGFVYESVSKTANENGVEVFPATADATDGSAIARSGLTIEDAEATKELKLTVKVKPGTGNRQEIRYADVNKNQVYLFSIKDGTVWAGSTNKFEDTFKVALSETLDTTKWYTIEVIFNRETKKLDFTIMNESGDVIGTSSKTLTQTFNQFASIYLISYFDEVYTQCYFDDLKVERVFAEPTVKSLEFISADGKTSTDATKVSSITKKINIDFGTVIDKQFLTTDYIKLVKFGTDTKANYFIERNGDVVTLNISGGLESNSNYELIISAALANQDGATMSKEEKIKISIGDGAVSATVAAMVVDGKVVEHVNDVVNGQNATIEYDYINSTGKGQTIYTIVAYYIGNRMTYVDYITTPVAGNVKATTIQCPHVLGDMNNIDTIKIFAWDGFKTMRPISQGKVIQ